MASSKERREKDQMRRMSSDAQKASTPGQKRGGNIAGCLVFVVLVAVIAVIGLWVLGQQGVAK